MFFFVLGMSWRLLGQQSSLSVPTNMGIFKMRWDLLRITYYFLCICFILCVCVIFILYEGSFDDFETRGDLAEGWPSAHTTGMHRLVM